MFFFKTFWIPIPSPKQKRGPRTHAHTHTHTHARTRNMAKSALRAWYVLFYKIFTGILCLLVFFPVFLFRFCFCSSIFVSFLFLFRFFCFVFVFVPVKRTPRILLWRAWSVLFFDFLPGILCFFGFFSRILFRFCFCSGKEDPKD